MARLTHPQYRGTVVVVLLVLALARQVHASQTFCAGGDSACLIAAMVAANAEPGTYAEHVITLAPGVYTFTTPHPTAPTGDTALPLVTGGMTIVGQGVDMLQVQLMRSPALGTPPMRLFEIAPSGTLVLVGVTVQGGLVSTSGGGIRNDGILAAYNTVVRWNEARQGLGGGVWTARALGLVGVYLYGNRSAEGGGLYLSAGYATLHTSLVGWNAAGFTAGGILVQQGVLDVRLSTLVSNSAQAGGGIVNTAAGTVYLTHSAMARNLGDGGAAIQNAGFAEVMNSTVAQHDTHNVRGGLALTNIGTGTLLVYQSTVARNNPTEGITLFPVGGIQNGPEGLALLANSLVAFHNDKPNRHDCLGVIFSLDHNLIGDPSGCDIALRKHDRTGDPGLGAFVSTVTPGVSFYPLLPTSQVLGQAHPALCPQTDQLGQVRDAVCDIGAFEVFQGAGGVAQR